MDVEEQSDQSGSDSLPRESGGSEHAAGAAGTLRGCRSKQHVVVGRLEKAEAHTAEHQPPHEAEMVGIDGYERKTETTDTHDNQPHPAQDSGVNLTNETPASGATKTMTSGHEVINNPVPTAS